MRSPNKFISKNRFISYAKWHDSRAAWMLFPAVWVFKKQEVVFGVTIDRWTVGWLKWRFQLDIGLFSRPDPKAPIEWSTSGLDGFLNWGKQVFQQKWGRADLDRLFRNRPEWKRLVALGGANPHYVRLLLARELFQEPESIRPIEEGLSALEAALEINETEIEDPTWSISHADPSRTAAGPGTVLPPKPNL